VVIYKCESSHTQIVLIDGLIFASLDCTVLRNVGDYLLLYQLFVMLDLIVHLPVVAT
jgi:hypothetical protein